MAKIVKAKYPVAAITGQIPYLEAREEADRLAEKYGLAVADMPMAIQAMASDTKVRKAIRPRLIDTITGEYQGWRGIELYYEVWHSVGSLATAKGLKKALPKVDKYSFLPITEEEWISVEHVTRLHLDDLKKGNAPAAGTPYTVFVRLYSDLPIINSGYLKYDDFMRDDRCLMVAGSPENREALAKMLFGSKGDGGEGRHSIGSYHNLKKRNCGSKAKGKMVYLNYDNGGFCGGIKLDNYFPIEGRFLAVNTGAIAHKKLVSRSIVQPTLEQALEVIINFGLNREGMAKAIACLYGSKRRI